MANQPPIYDVLLLLADRLQPVASLAIVAIVGIGLLASCMYRAFSAPVSTLDARQPEKWVGGWASLISLWLFFDVSAALAGGRAYPHYFLTVSASLSVMVGIVYWYVIEQAEPRNENSHILRIFAVCTILSSAVLAQISDLSKLELPARKATFNQKIIDYLNNEKEENSTLFSWIYEPRLYFETGLTSPHKLTSSLNLRDSPYMREVFSEDLLSTLESDSPTFLIDAKKGAEVGVVGPVYDRFQMLIEKKYELVKDNRRMRLYRKRGSNPGSDD